MEFDREDLQILHMLMGAQFISLSPTHMDRETLEQLSLSLSEENSQQDGALSYPELFRNQSPEEFRQNLYRSVIKPPQIENRSLQADLLLRELFLPLPDEASIKKTDQKPGRTSPNKTLEELKNYIGSQLADLGPYDQNRVFELLQLFGNILIEYPKSKNHVADYLADLGYTSLLTEHMSQISVLDALHSENARTLCTYALCLCLNLSACSAKFANCLARDGAVKLLTEILLYEPYLLEGANVEIVSLIRTSLDILNNIARCEPDKTCFEKENTTKALEQILTWNYGCLDVRAMLTLAFVMNNDQLMAHTVDNEIISKIVFWLKKACDNEKGRSHCSFSPRDIAESLTKLAANDSNKAKIIQERGLEALTKMLVYGDPDEQICSAECIMTIALDVRLRPDIVDKSDVIEALLGLGESSREEVRLKGMCTFFLLADMGDLTEMMTDQERPSTSPPAKSSQEPVTTCQQQSLPSSSQSLTAPRQTTGSPSQETNFHSRSKDGTDNQLRDLSPISQTVKKTQAQHNITRVPLPANISSQQCATTPQQRSLPTQLRSPSNTTKSVSTPSPKRVTSQAPQQVTLPTQMSTTSPRKPVDDHKAIIVDAKFFVEYLTLRGVVSDDIKVVKDILGNSNPQNQRKAILDYASKKEKCDIFSEALKYNDTYVETFKVVIQTSLKNANSQFKDGVYTNISWNSIREMVFNLTQKLECKENYTSMEAYGYQYSLNLIKHLFSFDLGEKIGNYLTELRYSETASDVILRLSHEDILQMNNTFAYTAATLDTCISYSDVSKEFVKSLVAAGLVKSLTAHINEECFLKNLDDEFVYASMTNFLTILYNIAYHLDTKQCFKDYKTNEAIKNFPFKDKRIEITVMLTLVYTLDEQELDNLPDVSNVIENIIKYMTGAMENKPTRRHRGMSLSELTRGLTVLAIKSSNRIKIACKDEAVAVLTEMLRQNDQREHISSARCLQALAVESTVRKRLLEFPDLVVAMEELRLNGSLNVRKSVEDALAMLRKSIEEDETDKIPMKRLISNDSELMEGAASAINKAIDIVDQATPLTPKSRGVLALMRKLARRIRRKGNKKSEPHTFNLTVYHDQSKSVINLYKEEGDFFTAAGRSEKLKPEDEQTITQHWDYLIEELDATYIISDLIDVKVFDVDDKREIMDHASRKKRTEIMLQKLLNAGPGSAFKLFMDVLEKEHRHIADKLRE